MPSIVIPLGGGPRPRGPFGKPVGPPNPVFALGKPGIGGASAAIWCIPLAYWLLSCGCDRLRDNWPWTLPLGPARGFAEVAGGA